MKRVLTMLMVLGITLGFIKAVQAAETDNIHITIAPNANYHITIASGDVNVALGTVDLSASTQTVAPATVTINSTYAETDLRITGSVDGGWSFDTSSTSVDANKIAAWVAFTAISRTSAPVAGSTYFLGTSTFSAGSGLISGTLDDVGTAGTFTDRFEVTTGPHTKDMDTMAPSPDPSATSHMWFHFRMPSSSNNNGTKNMNFLLTAGIVVP